MAYFLCIFKSLGGHIASYLLELKKANQASNPRLVNITCIFLALKIKESVHAVYVPSIGALKHQLIKLTNILCLILIPLVLL